MPSKNTLKTYVENSYYHIYNKGLNQELVFRDLQDSVVFRDFLEAYLSPPPSKEDLQKSITISGQTFKAIPRQPNNYAGLIELVSYCLMPTHFHFLIRNISKTGIAEFMRSLGTRYVMYYNRRHNRQGPVFQSRYKGILVDNPESLIHLSRFIHRQPAAQTQDLANWHSSYGEYLGTRQTPWVHPQTIQELYQNKLSYQFGAYKDFVENPKIDSKFILGNLTLSS